VTVTKLKVFAVAAVVAAAGSALPAQQAADGWYGRNPKLQTLTLQDPGGAFRVEYPRKDWMVVPGGGASVLTLTHKKGEASVVLERSRLNQALEPSEITELFAQLEADYVKEVQLRSADLKSRVIDDGPRRLAAVQFVRQGQGGPETVRQYSIPVGRTLYRLICVSTPARIAKYEAVFAHIAASFAAAPAKPS
jgi:hypothetical protein